MIVHSHEGAYDRLLYSFLAMRIAITLFACCALSLACSAQTKDKTEWSEQYNSPGATMVVKETDRARVNGQTVVKYHLFVSNLPKDSEYALCWKLPGTEPQTVASAFINKDGLVVNVLADPANNVAEDPIDLIVVAGRGEPKEFALISNDGKFRVFAEVVPFPISKSNGPCTISAKMMGQDYFLVLIVVTGLQSKEEFQIKQRSGNEGGTSKATATENGSYRTNIFPFVKGEPSGKLQFAVTAKTCNLDIEVPWGRGSYQIQ